MRIPLFHVDAFSDKPWSGNPAAVCLLDSWLDDGQLRKVAAENNLSATAFLVPFPGSYELRWFNPLCEVRLCGHATIASAYILLTRFHPQGDSIRFRTKFHGNIEVTRMGDLFCMALPVMPPKVCSAPDGLFEALGLKSSPVGLLGANETYLLVLETAEAVRSVTPNFPALEKFHPHAVAVTAQGVDVDFVSRYFAPSYGVPEDPVTGSLHCSLAPYWAQHLDRPQMHARQLSERGGEIWCDLEGDRVIVKGKCVLTMEATLEI